VAWKTKTRLEVRGRPEDQGSRTIAGNVIGHLVKTVGLVIEVATSQRRAGIRLKKSAGPIDEGMSKWDLNAQIPGFKVGKGGGR